MKKYFYLLPLLFLFWCAPVTLRSDTLKDDSTVTAERLNPLIVNIEKALAELDAKSHILHNGIIVFPLLDKDGKTTELGTLISILGMFRATYVPERIINIYFPEIEQRFYNLGYMQSGNKLNAGDIQILKKQFMAEHQVTGRLIINNEKFQITLKFEGPNGEKTVTKEDQKSKLHDLPLWIAENIHEYLRIKLSEKQEKYLRVPEFSNTESLLESAKTESAFWVPRPTQQGAQEILKKYEKLCVENPSSVFLVTRRSNSAILNFADPTDIIIPVLKKYPEHDRLNYFYTYWLFHQRDFSAMIPAALKLLERSYTIPQVYDWLNEAFAAQGLLGEMEKFYNYWIKHAPQDFLAYLNRGSFYIEYAWDARGGGWADTVTEEGGKKFRERAQLAEKDLEQAFRLNPEDPRAPIKLMAAALALGKGLDYVNKWFDIAVKLDPKNPSSYAAKIFYLQPKWYGSKQEMLSFTEECLKKFPESSIACVLLYSYSDQDTERTSERENVSIYADPSVWKKIKGMFTLYLNEQSDAHNVQNILAKYAVENKDYEFALKQFTAIETYRYTDLWGADIFHKTREETLKAINPDLTHEEFVQNTVSAYKKRIDSDAKDVDALIELAYFYNAEKKDDMAIPFLLKAQELDITNANIQITLGEIFHQQEKYEEAIKMCQKSIMNYLMFSNPEFYSRALHVYEIMARCYYESGDIEKAVAVCEKGLTIFSEYEYISRRPYYYSYANLNQLLGHLYYFKMKQPDKAIPCFEMSQKLEELANSFDLACLGIIYEEKGNLEKAVDYYKKALLLQGRTDEQSWEIQTAKTHLQKLTTVGKK